MRYHVYNWNKRDKERCLLILTEDDVENESNKYVGATYDILILPKKYENVQSDYLFIVRLQIELIEGDGTNLPDKININVKK